MLKLIATHQRTPTFKAVLGAGPEGVEAPRVNAPHFKKICIEWLQSLANRGGGGFSPSVRVVLAVCEHDVNHVQQLVGAAIQSALEHRDPKKLANATIQLIHRFECSLTSDIFVQSTVSALSEIHNPECKPMDFVKQLIVRVVDEFKLSESSVKQQLQQHKIVLDDQ